MNINNGIEFLGNPQADKADLGNQTVRGRAYILEEAGKCVLRDRQATHGSPEDSFTRTAKLWEAYLGHPVSAVDVTAMLALLKVARLRENPGHADNWIDLAGYAACGGELALKA